jgi:hypothetical protein
MTTLYHNPLFAPVDIDLHLERIGGGNETEVYCTDDRRYVVKVKSELGGSVVATLEQARQLRNAARRFSTVMGSQHSVPNYFLIAANGDGAAQLLILQPFHERATPLFQIDYARLRLKQRLTLAGQLVHIIGRAIGAYRKRGWMPDLYGRSSRSSAERAELNRPHRLPWRLWSFLVQRNLLRAHNLMLTTIPDSRVILIDYDPVTRGKLYRQVYYFVRLCLFLRDLTLIGLMVATGWAPRAV